MSSNIQLTFKIKKGSKAAPYLLKRFSEFYPQYADYSEEEAMGFRELSWAVGYDNLERINKILELVNEVVDIEGVKVSYPTKPLTEYIDIFKKSIATMEQLKNKKRRN